ncbi:hypothetical protein QBC32DRAFT_79221 [Pseudoneurospora amorphoporcata]|uniref:Uncharacterized protein n=1 Tax=Pseudoneurospora amorphoporcata TaxID=241081 RepID=A0AAN6NM64_9PEZI|nr:hypothetical protein QBC32DRAFT_79221 [Pseudoneurospora amorphoporcata]
MGSWAPSCLTIHGTLTICGLVELLPPIQGPCSFPATSPTTGTTLGGRCLCARQKVVKVRGVGGANATEKTLAIGRTQWDATVASHPVFSHPPFRGLGLGLGRQERKLFRCLSLTDTHTFQTN